MRSVASRQTGNRRRDSGAALVEFALVSPLLFSLLLGIVTGGFALATKNSMANAVREGARVGATLPEGTGWTADWAIDVKDRVVELAGGDLEDAEVCVQLIDTESDPDVITGQYPAAGCGLAMATPDTPTSATGCVIKVWATSKADLNVLFFTQVLDLEAKAVGRYERDECP